MQRSADGSNPISSLALVAEVKRPVMEQKSSVFSRLGVTKIIPVTAPSPRLQLQSVKSRLGSRITLTGDSEDTSEALTDAVPVALEAGPETHVSVHSRLGPRRSMEDNSAVKKRKIIAPSQLSRPTMVADEVEDRMPTGIHARLKQGSGTLAQRRGPLGKRSVVFQQLH